MGIIHGPFWPWQGFPPAGGDPSLDFPGAGPQDFPRMGNPPMLPLLKAEDEQICWEQAGPGKIYNHVPGHESLAGSPHDNCRERCSSFGGPVGLESGRAGAIPGEVVAAGRDGILVVTGKGMLRILELQLQGGRRLEAADFLRGKLIPKGTVLGSNNLAGGESC